MASVEAFKKIQAPLLTMTKLVGAEIWTSEKRFQPISYVLMAHMAFYNVCNLYSIVRYITDPIKLMQVTLLFGLATRMICWYFHMTFSKESIKNVFRMIEENIYRRYSTGTAEEKALVGKTTRYLEIIFKVMVVVYPFTLVVFAMWPIYVYLAEDQLIPLFMYEIPGVDPEQSIGYVITLLYQFDMYVLGLVGMILADYIFFLLCLQALLAMNLFMLHLKNLGDSLTVDTHEKDLEAIAEKWKECILDHQFVTELLNGIEDISGFNCLVIVFTCYFTIGDALLLVTVTTWYGGLFFLVAFSGLITIQFLVGNIIELKIDEMYKATTALPWNLLSVSQQKEFGYLLARSQRPLNLTCFGFAPFNLETYTSLAKVLYQFFILVLQYVK